MSSRIWNDYIRKLIRRLMRIRYLFFADNNIKKFIRHNQNIWRNWAYKGNGVTILVDFYDVNQTNIAFSYFVNILARKYKANIKSFSLPEKIPNRVLHKVYESFNVMSHIITSLSKDQKRRMLVAAKQIIPTLKTKNDIFNLSISGVWVGIDIYESYLRNYSKPTIDLNDPKLFKLVEQGIGLVIYWEDYFSRNKICAVIASHDCYLNYDVICKIAYKYKIPVYFSNSIYMIRTEKPHTTHSYFRNYRKMFKKLSSEEQKNALAIAKQQLNRRFSGEIGVDIPWSTKSAFHSNWDNDPVLGNNENIKVLICTHCFYDNPQGFGGMLFLDFYEWLDYLGKISERTNYDWYLKMHPDPLPGTLEIIKSILKQYPKIRLIPHGTSFHKLAKEGLDYVLTVYGTVGGECPLLGIQVINAGYNPRIAYDFNWHPKSIEEYEYYLLNLDKLRKGVKEEDVYEFYYMHYYYVYDDDFIFKSHRQLLSDLTLEERIGSKVYGYFMEQLSDVKHQEIINNMQKFIDSGKQFYFSHGPE